MTVAGLTVLLGPTRAPAATARLLPPGDFVALLLGLPEQLEPAATYIYQHDIGAGLT